MNCSLRWPVLAPTAHTTRGNYQVCLSGEEFPISHQETPTDIELYHETPEMGSVPPLSVEVCRKTQEIPLLQS